MSTPRPRRWWFQVSLRGLLGLVFVSALGLGWWVNSARTQAAAVAAIERAHPHNSVVYADEYFNGCRLEAPGRALDPNDERKRPWWVPTWLFRSLGRDAFLNVTSAVAVVMDPADAASYAGLADHLGRLRHLHTLTINAPFGDAEVARLAALTALRELTIASFESPITDRSVEILSRLPLLAELELVGDVRVTEASLARLARLFELRSLTLRPGDGGANQLDLGMVLTRNYHARPGDFAGLTRLEIALRPESGVGLRPLGPMPLLVSLTLAGQSIRDADLDHLAACPNLKGLALEDSTIDGTGFGHLVGLIQLTDILVTSTNLTDGALPILARLPALETLSLIQTRITSRGLEALRDARNLRNLAIEPPVLGDADRLKQVFPRCNLRSSIAPAISADLP